MTVNTAESLAHLDVLAAGIAADLSKTLGAPHACPHTQGAELEYAVVDARTGEPVVEEIRDKIIEAAGPELVRQGGGITTELGAPAIEIRTHTVSVDSDFADNVLRTVTDAVEPCKAAAAAFGACLIGTGMVGVPVQTTNRQKYHDVPDFHDRNRRRDVSLNLGGEGARAESARDMAATNAIHINTATADPAEAVRMHNAGLALDGLLTAIFANAPILNGKITGYQDARLETWERTHDTRAPQEVLAGRPKRAGLPAGYIGTLEDYIERVCEHPSIFAVAPEAAWAAKVGTTWPPARIKFHPHEGGQILLSEWRSAAAQPSIIEAGAAWVMIGGLQEAARMGWVATPSFFIVQENSRRGRRGLSAKFLEPGPGDSVTEIDGVEAGLWAVEMAEAALATAGAASTTARNLLRHLRSRIATRPSPARQLVERVLANRRSMAPRQAILSAHLELQRL